MALSFEELKKARSENLLKNKQKFTNATSNQKFNSEDSDVWKPVVDKTGVGYAIIRFLPAPQGEDDPFVRVLSFGFKGPGGWYIEKSRTTIGLDDPAQEYNSSLWDAGREEEARKCGKRTHFYSNIVVIRHPGNPADEGKVFRYRYGKSIFDKLNDAMNPKFDDVEPLDPFDPWGGANFRLEIQKGDYGPNYSSSHFLERGMPIFKDEAKIEEVWKQAKPLQELIDSSAFKTYEELSEKLTKTLKGSQFLARKESNVVAIPRGKTAVAPKVDVEEDLTLDNVDDIFNELEESLD